MREFKPTGCTEAGFRLAVEIAKTAKTLDVKDALARVAAHYRKTQNGVEAGTMIASFSAGGGHVAKLITLARDLKKKGDEDTASFLSFLMRTLIPGDIAASTVNDPEARAERELPAETFRYETAAIGLRVVRAAGLAPGRYDEDRVVESRERVERYLGRKLTPEERTAVEGPHECAEDNQGLCHVCGQVLNEERWREYHGDVKPGIERR